MRWFTHLPCNMNNAASSVELPRSRFNAFPRNQQVRKWIVMKMLFSIFRHFSSPAMMILAQYYYNSTTFRVAMVVAPSKVIRCPPVMSCSCHQHHRHVLFGTIGSMNSFFRGQSENRLNVYVAHVVAEGIEWEESSIVNAALQNLRHSLVPPRQQTMKVMRCLGKIGIVLPSTTTTEPWCCVKVFYYTPREEEESHCKKCSGWRGGGDLLDIKIPLNSTAVVKFSNLNWLDE